MAEVYYKLYYKFISNGKMQLQAEGLAEVYYKFLSDGKMQLRLEILQRFITSLSAGIWQRFIPSLLVADRSS